MTRTLDLDAARRAREEILGDPPTIIYKEKTYTLPHEQPYAWGEAFSRLHRENERAEREEGYVPNNRRNIRDALVSVLGEEQFATFEADDPSEDDVGALITGISTLYTDSGEALASSDSSPSGTRPSKRTGKESTDET